jgi:hypothetical protein
MVIGIHRKKTMVFIGMGIPTIFSTAVFAALDFETPRCGRWKVSGINCEKPAQRSRFPGGD